MRNSMVVALAAAMAVPAFAGMSPAEKAALKSAVKTYPTRFEIPVEYSDVAWGRATEWVTSISDIELNVSTDTVLQTFRAWEDSSTDLWCTVNRRSEGANAVFTLECGVNNSFSESGAARSTAMLARYVMTSDVQCLEDGVLKRDAAACLVHCEHSADCAPRPVDLVFESVASSGDAADTASHGVPDGVTDSGCSVEQITAMAKAGLSDEQIKAACGT